MILFSSDKEIIFKIINGILLLWLIAAIVITCSQVIQMVVGETSYTYNEYKATNCYFDKQDVVNDEDQERNCISSYKSRNSYEKIALYSGIANIIIVGGVLYVLNKKKKK